LKVREIWAIRIRLQLAERLRDLALFNLAIDSKLRGCDLVALRVRDVAHGGTVAHRAIVLQHKTQQPVQFDLTDQTRESVAAWIAHAKLRLEGFLFPSRVRQSPIVPATRRRGKAGQEDTFGQRRSECLRLTLARAQPALPDSKVPAHIHPGVQHANNQDASLGSSVEDDVPLVAEAPVAGPNVVGRSAHARILAQQFEATLQ
jgi:hypothetical protein